MGIDFVAMDPSGNAVCAFASKWLRDYAPRELFWGSPNGAGKAELTIDDLKSYQQEFKSYIQDLHFVEANPEEEGDYDKWVSTDGQKKIDSDIYEWIQNFVHFLQNCIDRGFSARWSI